jgi:hypothetical protein
VQEISTEAENHAHRVQELTQRQDELHSKEAAARKALLDLQLRYADGLTRIEAEALRSLHDKTVTMLDECKREVLRHKEIALIATEQATALSTFKNNSAAELKELKEYCTTLEARSDDELLIGRLQRKLMSTTTSYKAFTRKYQQAREAMRRRELAIHVLGEWILLLLLFELYFWTVTV